MVYNKNASIFRASLRKIVIFTATLMVAAVFLSVPATALEGSNLIFLCKDIYVDGVLVENYRLSNPIVIKDGRTHIPLSEDLGAICGFAAEVEGNIVKIKPTTASPSWTGGRADEAVNFANPVGESAVEFAAVGCTDFNSSAASEIVDRWDRIKSPVIWSIAQLYTEVSDQLSGRTPEAELLNSSSSGVIFADGIPYVPLAAFTDSAIFNWSSYYDLKTGLYISTVKGVPAESHYNENNASYIEGRAAYIKRSRKELSDFELYLYEYLFRHHAKMYNLDQEFLMALSRAESTFQRDIVSRAGAVGMMQIMPSSARGYGITPSMLKDPRINIDFGAKYIRDRLWMYDGDEVKALSAYNQGVPKVNGGNYKTGFASKVLKLEKDMKNFLIAGGYSMVFDYPGHSEESSSPALIIPDILIYR